ncbi:TRAP transporter substrate-binding protein [Desulfoluna spongiiphila]|uniref:Tripartite ATP-independent transporter solute receptor, DctP family n=1 Tax=Desulfoluna spongiiphila TaxID=419481 RepID=A0A1G5F0P2_9BACT|nr:TRAP transporter substrate-binding protein [Desulfoluna spongiiphila]SCY32772.1 tripartite ATP-independent transporter solute receptor, DctP family [Desulfoluna spongiiphila]VVS94398.1 trap transporter solute receptor dctp/teaa [Desulfoluna spongiiphila]
MKRVALCVAMLFLMAAFSAPVSAKVVMNLGWQTADDSAYGELVTIFSGLVDEYTQGEVVVKRRCCGQIGGEEDGFKSLQIGIVDGFIITMNNVSPHYPLMDVFVLPYIFNSLEHASEVLEGPIGDRFRDQLYAKTGVYLLSYNAVEPRDMYNTKRPIRSMDDMKGLKLRVPKNKIMISTFQAFGAEPVPLAWSEMSTALQTGTVEGGDNGTFVIRSQKFFDLADNLTVLDHFTSFSPLFCSKRFLGKLTDAQRDAVIKAGRDAGRLHRANMLKKIEECRSYLEANGMKITRPDRTPFIEAARKLQDEILSKRSAEFREMVDQIRASSGSKNDA